jgi:hypothetical protein
LGNAQIKVKRRWGHFPPSLQPMGNKKISWPIAHIAIEDKEAYIVNAGK